MPLKVKICGLTEAKHVEESIKLGADFCGFIVNYKKSHRCISQSSKLKELTNIKKSKCKFVAVLVNPTNLELKNINKYNFDFLQLHGEESFKRVKEIKRIFKKKIIKTIKIKQEKDVEKFKKYKKIADIMLFDSFGLEKSKKFNHEWLKDLPESIRPWMLAGKINIRDLENVSKIADYVDVSGSLETKKKKDIRKIKNFLGRVKKINDTNKKGYTSN